MREKIKYVLCAFLTVVLLNMDMQPVTDELMRSLSYYVVPIIFGYSGYNLFSLLEIILFYFFYRYSFRSYHRQIQTLRSRLCCFFPAVLFGFFMVLGNSFAQTDSWGLIIGCENPVQLFKSLFAWFCYSILFVHLIALLFDFIDRYRAGGIALDVGKEEKQAPAAAETAGGCKKKKPKDYDLTAPLRRFGRWYMRMLTAHTFLTAFLTLLVVYLPVVIAYYPAIVSPDSTDEICQIFGVKSWTADTVQLVDENVVWINHHPVFYTLYLWLGLNIGNLLFHSYAFGLFLCTLGQIFAFAAVVASAVRMLIEYRVPRKVTTVLLLYFAVSPRIITNLPYLTKDIFYICALLCVCMGLLRMLTGREKRGTFVRILVAVFFATLLRNEGMYVMVLSFFTLFLFKKGLRRKFFAAAALALGVYLLWNQAILPAFHVTPGSVREALSVPFQQTARYVKEYGDEVTAEEREAIDSVLDYEKLAETYWPTLSDEVKNLYRKESGKEELFAYFRVWIQMFFKHPGVYIEATLNNTFRYFYLTQSVHENYTYNLIWYDDLGVNMRKNGIEVTFGSNDTLRAMGTVLDGLLTTLDWLPGGEILQSSALYVWLFLLLIFYACKTKNWQWIWSVVPVGVTICVCFAGPADAYYFRYILPTACALPPIAVLLVFGKTKGARENTLPDTMLQEADAAKI